MLCPEFPVQVNMHRHSIEKLNIQSSHQGVMQLGLFFILPFLSLSPSLSFFFLVLGSGL